MLSIFIKDIVVKEEYQIQESNVVYIDNTSIEPDSKGLPNNEYDTHNDKPSFPITETFISNTLPPPKLEPPDQNEKLLKLHNIRSRPEATTLLPNAPPSPKFEPPEEDEDNEYEEVADIEFLIDSIKKEDSPYWNDRQTLPLTHTTRSRKTFCCYSCGNIYLRFNTYQSHYLTEHPDMIENGNMRRNALAQESFVPKMPKEMLCKYCLKKFSDSEMFHAHMDNAHPDKLFLCPLCPKSFRRDRVRQTHINVHEGIKPYQCPHCPKTLTTKARLDDHVNIHLNIKPFSCTICNKQFRIKDTLKIHEQTHTKEKAFQCENCDRSFPTKCRLDIHMRVHKDIRDYKCPHCEKTFHCAGYLKNHIATHTNKRPYRCDICGLTFKLKSSMQDHLPAHSNEKNYECTVCGKTFVRRSNLPRRQSWRDGEQSRRDFNNHLFT